MLLEIFFTLAFGLCFGSFNTLLIHRLPTGRKIALDRSACPVCNTALGVADLVPVFSWLFARATCRHCDTPIHWRYPAIELVTALVFWLVYSFHGFTWEALLLALLGSQIVVLCIIDFEHRIIPDELQITMGLTGVVYGLLTELHIATMVIGMLLGGLMGLALQKGFKWWKKQDGLGMGDVKFMAVAGIWLGAAPLIPFFFYGGVLGIFSALLWRFVNDDPRFPFGPALALSLFMLVLYPPSADWFLHLSEWMVTSLGII